jgi:hypothetical protein
MAFSRGKAKTLAKVLEYKIIPRDFNPWKIYLSNYSCQEYLER